MLEPAFRKGPAAATGLLPGPGPGDSAARDVPPGHRLLIAGNLGGTNVGDSFAHAAADMGLAARVVETRHAFAGPRLWRGLNWRLLGHRPPALGRYNRMLRAALAEFRPGVLLALGLAPVTADTLAGASAAGVRVVNYLTDDPWNPGQRSRWFFRALPRYHVVFSPRRANLADLRAAGCPRAEYLPFAYDPRFAHPVEVRPDADRPDVVFVGGADRDRVPILGRLIAAGFRVVIHGSYWENYRETSAATRGQADPATVRAVTAAAKVALCLVRRANRDGHTMRTFEIGAIGACTLAEDTPEHRDILGDAAVYFRNTEELLARTAALLADAPLRARLAGAVRDRITGGRNTYADRLRELLSRAGVAFHGR
jgi:spore maturation protein CgeB